MLNLEDNIFKLQKDLLDKKWEPDPYKAFYVRDPKLRHIHKASVRDRVLYQAVYRKLYGAFDKHFIYDSYSCRSDKGLHKGYRRLELFIRKSTKNYTMTSYVLKCDIRKFFDSISHDKLFSLIYKKIVDQDILQLVKQILDSFSKNEGVGLPLGNVTSQLFSNIYLNELDQFIKHKLKVKYYARYCDDFVIVNSSEEKLEYFIKQIDYFLKVNLRVNLHPKKVIIRKVSRGIDFLGYISMRSHSLLRTNTKKRIIKKIDRLVFEGGREKLQRCLPSYLGILKHTHGNKIADIIYKKIKPIFVEEINMYERMFKSIYLALEKYHLKISSLSVTQSDILPKK